MPGTAERNAMQLADSFLSERAIPHRGTRMLPPPLLHFPALSSSNSGTMARRFRRMLWLLAALVSLGFGAVENHAAALGPRPEYAIKAAAVYNLALFVQWPAGSITNAKPALVIGVLGNDPFGPYLSAATLTNTKQGTPIVLKACRNVEEAKTCQLLFISSSEKANLASILSELQGRNILTVGDMDGFTSVGGMVNLVADRTVHFQINLNAVRRTGLQISSQLLELAQIMRDAPAPK